MGRGAPPNICFREREICKLIFVTPPCEQYFISDRFSFRRQELQSVDTTAPVDSPNREKYDLYSRDQEDNQCALKVENLCKIYAGNHHALKNVTFDLKKGECFGLLGANGAGKSTMFGILSGELIQTAGTVNLLERSKGVSYCPQTNALDMLLTVEEIIHFYGRLRCIDNLQQLTAHTLQSFHLQQYKDVLVKNLSGGNRRKLSVAVTCFGTTSIVLMDEPTSDMDPITRSLVYSAIKQLIQDKRSVILTSHTISEIDRVCHRIGVMRQGRMITIAPPDQLKTLYGNCYLITVFYDLIEALSIERVS